MAQQVTVHGEGAVRPEGGEPRRPRVRLDLLVAVVLSVAALMTAWSAYQSARWGTVQSLSYGAATAARLESSRASTLAGQQTIIDVELFTSWLEAMDEEGRPLTSTYAPDAGSYSGFVYARFRDEFRPAVQAWLAEEPVTNADAPPSPFAMDEYVQAARGDAQRLEDRASASSADALTASERKDSYVLVTVMCSSVLFLGGVGSKLASARARTVTLGLAVVVLLATVGVLASFPVRI